MKISIGALLELYQKAEEKRDACIRLISEPKNPADRIAKREGTAEQIAEDERLLRAKQKEEEERLIEYASLLALSSGLLAVIKDCDVKVEIPAGLRLAVESLAREHYIAL